MRECIHMLPLSTGHGLSIGFPGGSDGKESACNAGDPGSIPESGRSPGEAISYPFQYSWASLVAQTEKAMASHSSTLAWKILWTEKPGRLQGSMVG